MPPSDTFSRLYISPPAPLSDSVRARRRIGALVHRFYNTPINAYEAANFFHEETGARISGGGEYWSEWDAFLHKCDLRDFLDAVTIIGRFVERKRGAAGSQRWFADARRVFSEEHLAYEIDAEGVVHPSVDQEFQRNRVSTVAGLQSSRYSNVLAAFQQVSDHLLEQPPNTKGAWRAVFAANEGLFRLMFPESPRLTAAEIDRHSLPVINGAYKTDAVALRAAQRITKAFKEWVDGSHNYRHEPGTEEPAQVPLELAIVAVSQGTSFLRWLRELDPRQS